MSDHANAAGVDFRPAGVMDRSMLETLVAESFATTRFGEIPMYAVRAAFDRPTPEAQVIVAELAGAVVGFVIFGEVAGAIGTGRLHFVGVPATERLRGIGATLCDAAVSRLVAEGTRNVVAELPDHPLLAAGFALLTRCGFAEASRVPDYYSDGVDLMVLQRATT